METVPPRSVASESIVARLATLSDALAGAPAVTCANDIMTWHDLHMRADKLAGRLAATQVGSGDTVVVRLPNGPDFVVACVAIWMCGAAPLPIAVKSPEPEVGHILSLAAAPTIVDGRFVEDATASTWPARRKTDTVADPWKVMASGGSTGEPKLIRAAEAATVHPGGTEWWRMTLGGTAVIPGPLYHNGQFVCAVEALLSGNHLVLSPRFDPIDTLRQVASHGADWLLLVPTMMSRIAGLDSTIRGQYDVDCLRTVWHLGAPCPPRVKQWFIDWLGASTVWELYAGTDGCVTTVISGHEWLSHPGSVGRPVVGDLAILRLDGTEADVGESGEVFGRPTAGARPPQYVGQAVAQVGEWRSIGDVGHVDREGYLYLDGRRDDCVIIGARNVYPEEVERAAGDYPAVKACVAFGVPDDDLGERIHLIVEGGEDLDIGDLSAHLGRLLAPYKMPRTIRLTSRSIRDEAGKVRRAEWRTETLAALAAHGADGAQ